MESRNVMTYFQRTDAILRNDHFVYASWKHGSVYVRKKMLYADASITALLCGKMARHALVFGPITCVVGPEKGGIILSQWVGYFLNEISEYRVTSVYAEKTDIPTPASALAHGPYFIFSDDYEDLVRGKDVLLVDDVVTTGRSLCNLAYSVRECGGKICGAVALWNRGSVTARPIGVPGLTSLVNISAELWRADTCPLCINGIPVNPHYGRGKEFIARGSTVQETPHHRREF